MAAVIHQVLILYQALCYAFYIHSITVASYVIDEKIEPGQVN